MKAFVNQLLRKFGYQLVRVHEELFYSQIRLITRPTPVIFDLGANVGQTTERYLEAFPSARLFSFEPGDEAYAQLAHRFDQHPQVRAEKFAVAEQNGRATYYVNAGSTTNSLLPTSNQCHHYMAPQRTRNVCETKVPTISLDSYCQQHAIAQIDILKMDIQGAEELALRGASRLLGEHRISLIYSEVLFGELYESQASFDDLCRLLRGHGYRLHSLDNITRGKDDLLSYGDAIFVAPQLAEAQQKPPAQAA